MHISYREAFLYKKPVQRRPVWILAHEIGEKSWTPEFMEIKNIGEKDDVTAKSYAWAIPNAGEIRPHDDRAFGLTSELCNYYCPEFDLLVTFGYDFKGPQKDALLDFIYNALKEDLSKGDYKDKAFSPRGVFEVYGL